MVSVKNSILIGSDPDLNMKLWNKGVRIFKGLGDFKVYHFGSIFKKKHYLKANKGQTFLKNGELHHHF